MWPQIQSFTRALCVFQHWCFVDPRSLFLDRDFVSYCFVEIVSLALSHSRLKKGGGGGGSREQWRGWRPFPLKRKMWKQNTSNLNKYTLWNTQVIEPNPFQWKDSVSTSQRFPVSYCFIRKVLKQLYFGIFAFVFIIVFSWVQITQ